MENIKIDFSKSAGKINPMHAVNNGPVYKWQPDQRITNIDAFREAKIPFVRNHDASFYATYGGEHTVDVHAIFPNFDADPYDSASYDFACTDEYTRVILLGGSEVYYRLGSKIEHGIKKYGTLPPPDFHKWAVICEHIIRHYNEGWADGFHYNIRYWEIWNEPDLDPDDSTHKRNWGGTEKQFFELFKIAYAHLKGCFPHLKIGGPAAASPVSPWVERFLSTLDAAPDFYSWHIYASRPQDVSDAVRAVREMLDRHGMRETESILNEWNYVKGWEREDWIQSIIAMKGLKGSAFIASTMCRCLYEDLDMLMYYDARPGGMNGMFDTDLIFRRLKGYYPFRMFCELYELGTAAEVANDADALHLAAATDGKTAAVMLSHFEENDTNTAEIRSVKLSLMGLGKEMTAEIYTLDAEHDMELTQTCKVTDELTVDLPLFTTVLVKLI